MLCFHTVKERNLSASYIIQEQAYPFGSTDGYRRKINWTKYFHVLIMLILI